MAAPRPFISYAREDCEIAIRLRNELVEMGAAPWMDQFDLVGGEDWRAAIKRALREASHCIVLLSHRAVTKRGYVQTEMRDALQVVGELPPDAVYIIPVRLDDVEPIHEHFRSLHWIDLFRDYRDGLRRLAASLGITYDKFDPRHRPSPAVPDPSPPPAAADPSDDRLVRDIWGKWRLKQAIPPVDCVRCGRTIRAAEPVEPLGNGAYAHYLDCLDDG
jgi:hypothetical protein